MGRMLARAHVHSQIRDATPTEIRTQRPRGRQRGKESVLKVAEDWSAQWLRSEAFGRRRRFAHLASGKLMPWP